MLRALDPAYSALSPRLGRAVSLKVTIAGWLPIPQTAETLVMYNGPSAHDVGQVQIAFKADEPGGLVLSLTMPLSLLAKFKTMFSEKIEEGKADPDGAAGSELVLREYLGTQLSKGEAADVVMCFGEAFGAGRIAQDDNNYIKFVEIVELQPARAT